MSEQFYYYFLIGNFSRGVKFSIIFVFFVFISSSIVHKPCDSLEVADSVVLDCSFQVII